MCKKNISKFLLLFVFFTLSQIESFSQIWRKIELEFDYITALRALDSSPNTIILGLNAFPTDFSRQTISFNNFGQGLIISKDGGKIWSEAKLDGYTVLDIVQSPDNPDLLFSAVTQYNRGGILKSTDGGETWSDNVTCDAQYKIMNIAPMKAVNGEFYASAVEVRDLIFTNDYFNKCIGIKNLNVQSRTLAISKVNPDFIFFASDGLYESGVFYSTDGGKTWNKNEKGLENIRVHSILASSHHLGLLYAGCDSIDIFKRVHGKGIYRSEDTGRTWHPVIAEGTIVWDIAEHPRYPKFIAAACGKMGVLVSANLGAYWEQYRQGLPDDAEVNKILIPNLDTTSAGFTALAAVYGDGLFITDGLNTSIDNHRYSENIGFEINPVPFNNRLNIIIESHYDTFSNLRILNMLGQIVFQSANLYIKNGINFHNIESTGDLSPGAYVIILSSDKFIVHRVILKN